MEHKIALVFDFDDTLSDDSTSALLQKNGFSERDIKRFCKVEVEDLVTQGWEPTLAWLNLFIGYVEGRVIKDETKNHLREFGRTLTPYEGLKELLDDLEDEVRLQSRRLSMLSHESDSICIDFYIISAGIQEVIDGFPLSERFKGRWGSQYLV